MGLGLPHLLLILVILLVFFGPSRLPGLGKSLGEAIKGFKDGLNNDSIDVTNSTRKTESLDEVKNQANPSANSASTTTTTNHSDSDKKNS